MLSLGMRLHAAAAAGVLLSLASGVETRDRSATELAEALQQKYNTIRDFSADFVHTYRGGVLKRQLTERGRLLIKKPGKMRWEYKTPEEKLFVSDGTTMHAYIPEDRHVVVSEVPTDGQASSPALFLAGRGSLTRDFTASLTDPPAGMPPGTLALKLVPIAPQPDYDWLVLAVDPGTLALRGLVTIDAQGGTSGFTFTNLKENVGLADKSFVFSPPPGVDVVTDSSRR